MVFYSPTALSFLIFFPLSLFISVLCSLFSLHGSWSVVLVVGLYSSPISLLFGCYLRFALPLALTGSNLWLSLSHALGFDLQVVGLYRGSDLGIFWWVCDLVLGGGFVIWFWMGMVCGGLVAVGLLVLVMVVVFFFFFLVGGGEWMWWLWVDVDVEVSFFLLWFFFFFFC